VRAVCCVLTNLCRSWSQPIRAARSHAGCVSFSSVLWVPPCRGFRHFCMRRIICHAQWCATTLADMHISSVVAIVIPNRTEVPRLQYEAL